MVVTIFEDLLWLSDSYIRQCEALAYKVLVTMIPTLTDYYEDSFYNFIVWKLEPTKAVLT